jgi:hypothetical protein
MARYWPGFGRRLGSELATAGSDGGDYVVLENERTPSEEGGSSFPVSASQELAVDVSNGGGGNCTRVPIDAKYFANSPRHKCTQGPSELCRDDEALRELITTCHRLALDVKAKIMDLARGST